MSTYGQRFNMLLTLISATYSYPLSSDSQSTDSTFFLDFWQQAAKWFSLLQFLQEAPHVGQFFFAKGCCLAQDLHMRSCVLFEGFSGTLFFFLPSCFPISSFTKRASSSVITFNCCADVSMDLQISIHWPKVSCLSAGASCKLNCH